MEEGRVEGGEEGEVKEVYYPRRNGWTCPWHPLQVLAWGFIAFFAATYFGFLVHYIPGAWRSIGYIVSLSLFSFLILQRPPPKYVQCFTVVAQIWKTLMLASAFAIVRDSLQL